MHHARAVIPQVGLAIASLCGIGKVVADVAHPPEDVLDAFAEHQHVRSDEVVRLSSSVQRFSSRYESSAASRLANQPISVIQMSF